MYLNSIADLNFEKERAVIINHNSKAVASLSLLSTIKYSNLKVLLIDCESDDGSLEHFKKLMAIYNFDLVSAPFNLHGTTLDWIFRNINSEFALLVDSDIEILNSQIFSFIKEYKDGEKIFGIGFTDGPFIIKNRKDILYNGMFMERMWIPFVYLNVPMVKNAIEEGKTFNAKYHYNDLFFSEFISRQTANLRRLILKYFNYYIKFPDLFKGSFYELKPSLLFYDTGAEIYSYLKYNKGFDFVGLPEKYHKRYMNHLGNYTKSVMKSSTRKRQKESEEILAIKRELETEYNLELD